MSTNKEAVIEAVKTLGEIGVAGLSQCLDLDKGTVRKVALEAAREGRINAHNNGHGYVFFPANGSVSSTLSAPVQRHDDRPIDATFREIPAPSSDPATSRALVPIEQDSRVAETLARNAAARRTSGGMRLDPRIAAALNNSFVADPEGDETLSALAAAINRNTVTVQAAENQRRAEAARAVAERPSEPPPPSWTDLLLAACAVGAGALNTHQNLAHQNAEARAETKATPPTPAEDFDTRHQFDEEEEPEFEEEEFEPEPEPEPTDFETFSAARTEQRRQATNPSYGRGHFETFEDDKGRVMVKPIIPRKSFADLLDFAKFKKTEAAKAAAKAAQRKDREPEQPKGSHVAELFGRRKDTVPKPEPAAPEPDDKPSWWRHFATPKKSRWI